MAFPPDEQTTLTQTIPSYLYMQYADDEDLQAFIRAFNELAQQYVTWFASIGLPVYTGDLITGDLLDWVARGLYGVSRPALSSGDVENVGPFNTMELNSYPFNDYEVLGDDSFQPTDDDNFKRIITWLFFKGDGTVFNVRWLKRRIARFLNGVNGVNYNVDQTYNISVTFTGGNNITITVDDYAPILKEAIDAGVLQLPFQYNWTIDIG